VGWTKEQDALLRATYVAHGSGPVMQATGYGRSKVKHRAAKLGLWVGGRHKGKFWTPEEDAVLRARYRTEGAHALVGVLDRSLSSIQTRAHLIGANAEQADILPWPVPAHDYTDADMAVMAWRYPTGPAQLMGRV
jgi:hypothetical protein